MLAIATLALSPLAQLPLTDTLYADVNPTPFSTQLGSRPQGFVELNGRVYFAASGEGGRELWSTDGSALGTTRVVDIHPGGDGSLDFFSAVNHPLGLLPGGAGLLVSADGGSNGRELWFVAPGASGPAAELMDIFPGPDSSTPENFVPFQGSLWFLADDGVHGRELWKSDGTVAGTQLAADLVPGSDSLWGDPYPWLSGRMASAGTSLILLAPALAGGWDLYGSDGSAGGTQLLATWNNVWSQQPLIEGEYASANGHVLFFLDSQSSQDRGLWSTDGTPGGTQLLLPAEELLWMVVDGNQTYVATQEGFSGGNLYITDGTPANTQRLTDLSQNGVLDPTPGRGVVHQGLLYFGARIIDPVAGNLGSDLAVSDGTPAGTTLALDLIPGVQGAGPGPFLSDQNTLYAVANITAGVGRELHEIDLVSGTATLIADVIPGPTALNHGDYTDQGFEVPFVSAAQGIVFPAWTAQEGDELYLLDPAGQLELVNLLPPSTISSTPEDLLRVGDKLFFLANGVGSSSFFKELFMVDAAAGTPPVQVDPINPLFEPQAEQLVAFQGGVAFVASSFDSGADPAVWWSDGNTVHRVSTEAAAGDPSFLTATDTHLYFVSWNNTTGTELWVSDGSPLSSQVLDLTPGIESSQLIGLTGFGDLLVARGTIGTGDPGSELVISDGTLAGTRLIDLEAGPQGSNPSTYVVAGNRFYFTADTSGFGREVWVSDGTALGTQMVADITPGSGGTQFGLSMGAYGERAVFGYLLPGGVAQYVSDGTTQGTQQIVPPGLSGGLVRYAEVQGLLYFDVGNSNNKELYVSDGTPQGTGPAPGANLAGLSFPASVELRPIGERALALPLVGADGEELWAYEAGIGLYQLADVFEGGPSGTPSEMLQIGNRIWFSGRSSIEGTELHSIELGAANLGAVQPVGVGCGPTAQGLSSNDLPLVGQSFDLTLDSGLTGAPALLFLDDELGALGASADCTLLLPAPIALASASSDPSGEAAFSLAIPNCPSLLGVPLYLQGAAVGLGQPFLGLASLSNALELVFKN